MMPPALRRPPPRKMAPPIETPESEMGISMVLFSAPGMGKTSLISHFPRPGFIIDSQEQGVRYLLNRRIIPEPVWIEEYPNEYRSWDKIITKITMSSADPNIDTLIIETLTGIENICFLHHAKEKFSTQRYPDGDLTSTGFFDYQKGPKNAARFDWPTLMEQLNLVLKSGKNVIITGHSMEKEATSPEGTRYQKNIPVCEKEVWTRLVRWASIVAFIGSPIIQDSEKSKGLKKVARPELDRNLYVEATPYCEAKNWWGLRGVIPCGDSGKEAYENFMRRLMNSR